MEIRRILVVSVFIFVLNFTSVFSYYAETTHPALADESVDFYNKSYTLQLSEEEKSLILQGSIGEDEPATRVINHFHDPVYNRGLASFLGISSAAWATDTKYQATYLNPSGAVAGVALALFSSDTDYSWERSIYEYVHGSKERGLIGLGHALHLVHDLTVPPHTRNDPHPPAFDFGSPYEKWTSRFTPSNLDVVSKLEGFKPIEFISLDQYFDTVSQYTNSGFFSRDTIFSESYKTPEYSLVGIGVLTGGESQSFGFSRVDGESYKLFELWERRDKKTKELDKDIFISKGRAEEPVLSDYWDILSKQAVLNGAGVIKLFFDEVEKEKETLALYYKNQSWLGKLLPKKFEPKYTKGDLTPQQNLAAVGEIFTEIINNKLQDEVPIKDDAADEEVGIKLRLAEEMIIPVAQLKDMSPPLPANPDLGGTVLNLGSSGGPVGPPGFEI